MFLSAYMLAGLLFILSSIFILHSFSGRYSGRLPPGSFGWIPFAGQTLSLLAPHLSSSNGRFLDRNIQQYGKIFRSHLFGHPTVVSCDAEFNSFILNNEGRLFTSSYPKTFQQTMGENSMLSLSGDNHKRLRGASLNLLATGRIQNSSFLSDIETNVLRVIGTWKNKKNLVFMEEARKFTFSVIVKQILSLEPDDPVAIEILTSFTSFMKGLVSFPINLPGTPYAKAIQDNRHVKMIVRAIQRQREEEQGVERRMDYLDVLLANKDLSDEEIYSLVTDLLVGGYETTTKLIALCVKFLADNPRALNDLREEHISVRKEVEDGHLGWKDYKNMKFTQCVINETLRLGNIAKFVHREAIKPISYKGYEIPVGWKVLPVFSGAHLDPSFYPDTYDFDPWRWQGVDTSAAKNFMPFGGGKRLCPGSELARVETSFFLHHLVLKFAWTSSEDEAPMSVPYVKFKNGLQIAIQPLD